MAAGKLNLLVEKGATFSLTLIYNTKINDVSTPVDLTGYTARAQFREEYDSPSAFVSLTSTSGIVLGGNTGTITLNIPANTTQTLVPDLAVWDLELQSGDTVVRLVEGKVRLKPEVTR